MTEALVAVSPPSKDSELEPRQSSVVEFEAAREVALQATPKPCVASSDASLTLSSASWGRRQGRSHRRHERGPARAQRGGTSIQRGRLRPAHRHFGSATTRTRTHDATRERPGREDHQVQNAATHLLTVMMRMRWGRGGPADLTRHLTGPAGALLLIRRAVWVLAPAARRRPAPRPGPHRGGHRH
jgi:hypothetical protein